MGVTYPEEVDEFVDEVGVAPPERDQEHGQEEREVPSQTYEDGGSLHRLEGSHHLDAPTHTHHSEQEQAEPGLGELEWVRRRRMKPEYNSLLI